MSSKTELAWCAGFFDGEGCAYLRSKDGTKRLMMHVGQVDRRPLERFQAAVGMGRINGPRPEPPHQSQLRFSRSQSFLLIDMLWPYLSEPKREQINRCVENEIRYKPRKAIQRVS